MMSRIVREKGQTTDWLIAKSFFYSKSPMLLLDGKGIVKEANCALRELMRTDLAGCKGHSFFRLETQLDTNLRGVLFPAQGIANQLFSHNSGQSHRLKSDNLAIAEGICQYNSPAFGCAKLRSIEIPLLNESTGNINGAVLSVDVLELDKPQQYHEALKKRWTHELMWEIYAVSYDRILPEMPFYQEVLRRHFAAMNTPSITNVLDLGAGTGNLAVQLLKEGKSITAVDISNSMLRKFYSKIDERAEQNLTIIEDTAERLLYLKSGLFDGVSVLLAFFDMQDPSSALGEAIRLLKPGGTLIVTDPKESFNVSELMDFAKHHLQERGILEELEEDWNRIQTVAPHVNQKIHESKNISSTEGPRSSLHAEKIYKILADLGFRELTFEDSHLGNCATIKGVKNFDNHQYGVPPF